MINSIELQALRNAEFLQFSKDVLSIVSLNDAAALNVDSQYMAFKKVTADIESLFKTDRGSPITAELEALDAMRDNYLTGISANIQSSTYHFTPTISSAALLLANHLSGFGNRIIKENYQSQTAIIDAILTDWTTKSDLTNAITTLKLTEWVGKLDEANKTFNTQYIARTQQLGAVSADTIKAKRVESAAAYYELRNFINAYFVINKGAEPFNKTTNEINALLAQYNALLTTTATSETVQTIATVDEENNN